MAELGDKILAPLQRAPTAQPDVEALLELRKMQRAAHSLQMEKIMLNQENELMVPHYCTCSSEVISSFQRFHPDSASPV